jgi:hypothetical protein
MGSAPDKVERSRAHPSARGGMRVVGQLGGCDVLAGDGSPVGNGDDGEVLEHRGANRRVRHGPKGKGSSGTVELTEGEGCGGGGFDSSVVDGELQHWRRQEVAGSGGGFVRGLIGEEMAQGGKGDDGERSTPF